MSAVPVGKMPPIEPGSDSLPSASERLQLARSVIRAEAQHLSWLASHIDHRIVEAADILLRCTGSAIVTGIGKAGIIGQKLSATLSSTGTRSHFLHCAEAIHGDLGKVRSDDVVIILSHSGTTEEVVRILPALGEQSQALIAITSSSTSPLGKAADVVLEMGRAQEACSLGLAPSTSTTAMLAVCDAMALLTSHLRGFTSSEFARYHPGGSLGLQLAAVTDVMRPLHGCRQANEGTSVREVLVTSSQTGRRTGAVMLTNEQGRLTGVFTDSDLVRLLERRRDKALDGPISEVMSIDIATISDQAPLSEAIAVLSKRRISELPVVDAQHKPVGLIDITDIVGLLPASAAEDFGPPVVIPFRRGS